jgi:hypothetical protein
MSGTLPFRKRISRAITPAASSLWIAIVQNADSRSLFDDLDAALQSGASEARVGVPRQVTKAPNRIA